ncbi:MAG: ATP-binding cassette domain-containing protein [Rhizobiales bacterium]|nr:ATP-binding cassette domain-containing protein [Hyphomicrobiales bacterium]
MSTLLDIQNVTVRFGGVTAVEDVSLSVGERELLGFIGPNGAGKTTLMRVITGMVRPQSGSVVFKGTDIRTWPIHKRIRGGLALAQQIVQPLRAFTLVENVVLAAGAAKTGNPMTALLSSAREDERAVALGLLERTGIAEAADRYPEELPLGFLKRLEVSRALALKPDLLLLDEPLAGLNQAEAESLADLIAKLAADGQAIMLIEHNIREVTRICPTLYVQDNGRALAHGPAEEVMADPAVRRAYLGLEEAC